MPDPRGGSPAGGADGGAGAVKARRQAIPSPSGGEGMLPLVAAVADPLAEAVAVHPGAEERDAVVEHGRRQVHQNLRPDMPVAHQAALARVADYPLGGGARDA